MGLKQRLGYSRVWKQWLVYFVAWMSLLVFEARRIWAAQL